MSFFLVFSNSSVVDGGVCVCANTGAPNALRRKTRRQSARSRVIGARVLRQQGRCQLDALRKLCRGTVEVEVADALLLARLVVCTRVPLSTYRLQFHRGFTFRDAHAVVDYLHDLGVSDCYASSYLKAVPASPHGYDVADPTRLNPEIGTAEEYRAWIHAMAERDMGHVMDLVPNHMGIAKAANPWWLDVLENGACSRFARFFDIEWHPVKDELANKVLIPILGDQYGEALERQELTLTYRDGGFVVRYYDETLPVAPDTYATIFEALLDRWLQDHRGSDADELQSILTAARNLPARAERGPEEIAARAREKEIVKRRLAGLVDAS